MGIDGLKVVGYEGLWGVKVLGLEGLNVVRF
jgi:hypothetical protein